MDEAAYVDHIRMRAKQYLAEMPPGAEMTKSTMDSWHYTKMCLSPHTFIEMCDAWLEKQAAKQSEEV